MYKSYAKIFAVSAVFGAVAAAPQIAKATGQTRTFLATSCVAGLDCGAGGTCGTVPASYMYYNNNVIGQVQNPSSQTGLVLMCPVVTDSAVPAATSTVRASVFGWANGAANSFKGSGAAACRTFALGSGGVCGARTMTSTNAVFQTQITDMSAWTSNSVSAADGLWIYMFLGPTSLGSINSLFSYQYQN